MSLEAILGINSLETEKRKEYNDLAKLLPLQQDELETKKDEIPRLFGTEKIKLPHITDDTTGRKMNMNFAKGTTTLAFIYKNGVVIAADSRATGGQYIGSQTVKKILPISKYLVGTMAGGAADCSYWERLLAERCRLYELRNRERISVAAASKLLANMLYNYRGRGLSLGVMICGWDHKKGPKIYMVDNDARRVPGNIFSIGSGMVYAYGVIDKSYRYDMENDEAFDLARRAIFHAAHRDAYSGGTVRVYVIQEDGYRVVSEDDFTVLYDRYLGEGSVSMDH